MAGVVDSEHTSQYGSRDMRDPLFDLGGQTALVSGASRGIGESIAHLLAAHGAHVVCASRKRESCEAVAEAIRAAGGSAEAQALHVGDPASIEALFETLDAAGRRATILVNNAAANPYFGPALEMSLAAYEKTVEVNLRGYFWTTVQAARRMQIAGGGSIVNIASVNARRPAFGQLVYSMTKAGIVNMSEASRRNSRSTASASMRSCPGSPTPSSRPR
jgi:NAD(P)-dependent dehydrogenase (short-subunit alcohol dehydrogenase family)